MTARTFLGLTGVWSKKQTLFPTFCRVVEIVLDSIKSFFQERSQAVIFFPANSSNCFKCRYGHYQDIKSGAQHANLHANFLTNLSGKLTL